MLQCGFERSNTLFSVENLQLAVVANGDHNETGVKFTRTLPGLNSKRCNNLLFAVLKTALTVQNDDIFDFIMYTLYLIVF